MAVAVSAPGNWDYYFTPGVTRARYGRIDEDVDVSMARMEGFAQPIPVKRPNFPNLGANVRDITDVLPQDFLPPTHLMEFIGFTSDIVEMMHPMLAQGMDFAHGLEEHKALLIEHARALRTQGADLVVVMSELGIHKDIALSRALAAMQSQGALAPGLIDMFFSAHTHEVTETPVTASEDGTALYAPVVEAGNDGLLGRMDITMRYAGSSTSGRRWNRTTEQDWTVAATAWRLLDVDETVPEDPAVKAMVEAERAVFLAEDADLRAVPFFMQRLSQPIDTVIGRLEHGTVLSQDVALSGVLNRKTALTSTFNEALTEMMRAAAGTEIGLTPGFRMGAVVPEAGFLMENGVVATGDITLEDAYRFFPMYYGLATATTTGAHMKDVIEANLRQVYSSDSWNSQGGSNYGYAGLDMTLDLSAGDGRRLLNLRHAADGRPVEDWDVLTVAGCRSLPIDFEGNLCGLPGFTDVTDVRNPQTGLPWSLVDVFTHMLQEQGHAFATQGARVSDISGTPAWPASPFVQPLEGAGDHNIPQDEKDSCGYFTWNCVTR